MENGCSDTAKMKTCSMCSREMGVENFSKNKGAKDGLQARCKGCCSTHNKEYMKKCRKDDPQHLRERRSAYYYRNIDRIKQRGREKYIKYREKRITWGKSYREENREVLREKASLYYSRNRSEVLARTKSQSSRIRRYRNARYRIDPVFRVSLLVRGRLRTAISRLRNGSRAIPSMRKGIWALVGLPPNKLIAWLGVEILAGGMHIDHICPLSQAITVEEVEKLNHYTNLRVIPCKENLVKSDKISVKGVILCRSLLGRDWIY